MSTNVRKAPFAVDALRRGIEDRDAEALLGLYADDAELVMVDADHGPSAPLVLRGREAIGAMLADVASRDMTHTLERVVVDDESLAYTEACRYADGMRVLCAAVAELADGKVVRQTCVQAWDAA